MRPQAGGMAVDLALEADREPEGRRDDQPDREVELERQVDHPDSVPAAPCAAHHGPVDDTPRRAAMTGSETTTAATLRARAGRSAKYTHPVNRSARDDAPLGARVADRVTDFIGSWTFIAHPDRDRGRSGSPAT